ncbi:MAG: YkgJ family cysteine cluster protein [Polyangiaceae bacterium]|nr:YkgJ family cysteine cluster protein [Polyangiaceae bacterium]
MPDTPFYAAGLRFSCTRCGDCCRRPSGHLFLSAADLRRLARALRLSDEEFFLAYCEVVDVELAQRVSLVATEDDSCVLLGDQGCTVYEHRPLQCRAYPFWGTSLVDAKAWDAVAASCPGVGGGWLWSKECIEQWLHRREQEPLLDVGEHGEP